MAANTAIRGTRRVYSAEELHRLRNTQSQPKLSESIEEHESEDADLVKGMISPSNVTYPLCRPSRGRRLLELS
ncbi:hypothetical protein Slin14017_G063480 [Septoria linicola]|nr:hypothetical protein Slin14017_G063480 [Septoria linicola]